MIEKNIRLQPHHARDLLVGRRSDGRRPGYQPPGHRDAPSGRGGSGGGGGGGGGGHHAPSPPSRPAPAPSRPTPSPHRDPEPAARVEPRVSPVQSVAMTGGTGLTGMTQTQAANVMEASAAVNRDKTGGVTLGEGMTGVPESIDFATARRLMTQPGWAEDATVYDPYGIKTPSGAFTYDMNYKTSDQGPVTRGGGADVIPEFVPRETTTITGGIPHREDPIQKIVYEPREGPARTYDPRTDPNALLKRGSGIMGTVKDKSIQMAKDFATRKAMKALGLGALNPFLGVGSWLLDKFAPGIKTKFASKFKAPGTGTQEKATKKLVSRDTRDGDGIQQAVTGGKDVVTESMKQFTGTTDEQAEFMKRRNTVQGILDQGSYQGKELTEQQRNSLMNYIEQISKFLVDPMEVAYGGRIDKPLGGRSRDIG
jgi:hypothetical protein